MHHFHYQKGKLFCENVSVASLIKKFGSPLYIYSSRTIEDHYHRLDHALNPLDHLVCYAVKANSNLAVLKTLANLGSGFDVVSGGELERVLAAGGAAKKCVFAGVGKSEEEIRFALAKGIYSFNVESEAELYRINQLAAKMRKVAPISVRVNPNVDAHTHAKITTGTYENKFGIAFEEVARLYAAASKLPHIKPRGLQMHIGSQLTEAKPFAQAVAKVAPLAEQLVRKHGLEFLSIGGGIGIVYNPALESGASAWWQSPAATRVLTPATYAKAVVPNLQSLGLRVLVEPGRFIVGNAGILVTQVEYVKRTGRKNFVIVNAAMNDLIRPAFYDSYHEVIPVEARKGTAVPSDVVGPICESGDYFCKDRLLPKVAAGEHLALLSAGAYGSVMASNYNTRGLVAEVLVRGNKSALVRERQPVRKIWELERIPDWL